MRLPDWIRLSNPRREGSRVTYDLAVRPTLTVRLNHAGRGEVLLNGDSLPWVCGIEIAAEVGEMTVATVRLVGVAIDLETDTADIKFSQEVAQ